MAQDAEDVPARCDADIEEVRLDVFSEEHARRDPLSSRPHVQKILTLEEEWKDVQEPSEWTCCHSVYLVLLATILPSGICFGVNYGVATALFRDKSSPTLWGWESVPIAGDFAMIVLVQQLLNWMLVCTMQSYDVLNGLVAPLRQQPGWWPQRENALHWWFQPPELILAPREDPHKQCCKRVTDSLLRGLFFAVLSFLFMWPLFTGASFAIWGNSSYNSYPQPQFMASVFGMTMASIVTPFWFLMVVIHIGIRIRDDREGTAQHVQEPSNALPLA